MPLLSTTAWTLLPSPPRDLPTACPSGSSAARFLRFAPAPCELGGTSGVRPVLVGTADRRVHGERPVDVSGRVGLRSECGMDSVPDSEPSVEIVALPYRLPCAELVAGQIAPRDPGPGPVDDALDDLPSVAKWMPFAALVRGQQRLDPLSLLVGQDLMSSRRDSHPSRLSSKTASHAGDMP